MLAKTDGHCSYCGCKLKIGEMHVDHRISLHNHGSDEMDNLVPSCHECNYYKGGCNPDGFRRKLKSAFRQKKQCLFVARLEEKYGDWKGMFYYEKIAKEIENG